MARAELLLSRIPRGLPRELHVLEHQCRTSLNSLLRQFERVVNDPDLRANAVQAERLRMLRRAVEDLDWLETVAIVALDRADPVEDVWLNRLVKALSDEVAYPLQPPVATGLSQSYFRIYPQFKLLCVPLVEGSFLLHLPDLYHELAHPLVAEEDDPRIRPFQADMASCLDHVISHFAQSQFQAEMRQVPPPLRWYEAQWCKLWWRYWLEEFFCDAFAACTVGPAYAWSHYHLVAKRGENPFVVPRGMVMTHPADDARMIVMADVVSRMGFTQEVQSIRSRWTDLTVTTGFVPEPEYALCYPRDLLGLVVDRAMAGTVAMGCALYTVPSTRPIADQLNEAWRHFWDNPGNYATWERGVIGKLRGAYGVSGAHVA